MYRFFIVAFGFILCGTQTPAQSDPVPPTINFFSTTQPIVAQYEQTAFFWKVSGDYLSIDLYGLNCMHKSVSQRESYLTPPLNTQGVNPVTLVVTGVDGSLVHETLLIQVTPPNGTGGEPEVYVMDLQVDSDRSGHFLMSISCETRDPVSWSLQTNVPQNIWFTPNSGTLEYGNGTVEIQFESDESLGSQWITFELSVTQEGDADGYFTLISIFFDSQTAHATIIPYP